jgi:excisionase family DNA binding protein
LTGEKLVYSVSEVAAVLGVGQTLIRSLVAEQRIPHARVGDRVLFPKAAIEAWLDAEAAASIKPEPYPVAG